MVESGPRYCLKDGRTLQCQALVRNLPGKRAVWRGLLDAEPVYAKLFLDPARGVRHHRRETQGMRALVASGTATPEVLFEGQVGDGLPALVLRAIPHARNLSESWREETHRDRRRAWLVDLVTTLARHHLAGICQQDLHFGNFLLSQGRLYSIDGAAVRCYSGPLPKRVAIANLALLLAQLPPGWDGEADTLLQHYARLRSGIDFTNTGNLLRRVHRARRKRWAAYRKKLFRECTAVRCRRTHGSLELVRKAALSPQFERLLETPDDSFPGTQEALKIGRTCTVWSTGPEDTPWVVKRYNIKNLRHSWALRIKRSRPLIAWENGHRLRFLDIPTPEPVAVIQGAVGRSAYLICERFKGQRADQWFCHPELTPATCRAMAKLVVDLIATMQSQRISHGDLKASNILVGAHGLCLIDLDSMRFHRTAATFKHPGQRDLRRFLQNWTDTPALLTLFVKLYEEAGLNVPARATTDATTAFQGRLWKNCPLDDKP